MIIGIDLGGETGICIKDKGKYYYGVLKKVTNKNIINKICEFMLKELGYVNLDSITTVATFLPQVFGGFFYKVLQKQFGLFGVLDHYFDTEIIKESGANKDILGRNKQRKTNKQKAETTKEWKEFTVKRINELGFETKSHDCADGIKCLLAYERMINKPNRMDKMLEEMKSLEIN